MIAVYIHNPHDEQCRDLLLQVRAAFPRLEVYDFHALKGVRHVQGAPCLWFFEEEADVLADEPVYRQDIEVDLDAAIQEYQQLSQQ